MQKTTPIWLIPSFFLYFSRNGKLLVYIPTTQKSEYWKEKTLLNLQVNFQFIVEGFTYVKRSDGYIHLVKA